LKRKAPVDLETLSRYHRVRTEPGAPEIPELRADLDRLARALHVRIYWTVPVPVQAYAWPTLHEIEVSPVVSEEAAAVVAHELGHIAQPCQPTHTRVPRTSGLGSLCCACEIEAWTWASMNLCRWSSAMQVEAGRCLRTYRPYGSEAEQAAIDRFCGTVSRAEIRLRRMSRNQETTNNATNQ
jgi:hypothetical protein